MPSATYYQYGRKDSRYRTKVTVEESGARFVFINGSGKTQVSISAETCLALVELIHAEKPVHAELAGKAKLKLALLTGPVRKGMLLGYVKETKMSSMLLMIEDCLHLAGMLSGTASNTKTAAAAFGL